MFRKFVNQTVQSKKYLPTIKMALKNELKSERSFMRIPLGTLVEYASKLSEYN